MLALHDWNQVKILNTCHNIFMIFKEFWRLCIRFVGYVKDRSFACFDNLSNPLHEMPWSKVLKIQPLQVYVLQDSTSISIGVSLISTQVSQEQQDSGKWCTSLSEVTTTSSFYALNLFSDVSSFTLGNCLPHDQLNLCRHELFRSLSLKSKVC